MPNIRPTDKAIAAYYLRRDEHKAMGSKNEGALRDAFQTLLTDIGREFRWNLQAEQTVRTAAGTSIRFDAMLIDRDNFRRGYWEAKDSGDKLEAEIKKKKAAGYPLTNIIFEDTRQGVLFQDGERIGEFDLMKPEQLAELLNRFFSHTKPEIEQFSQAVQTFREKTPELAGQINDIITKAHKDNRTFQKAFDAFFDLCKQALNPNISRAAVDEMLVQHLLTERLMRTVFDNSDFVRRNVIAAEVEKVIDALTSQAFNRGEFLKGLNYFYNAIEAAAGTLADFAEKQTFINTVYERFFQGYAVDVADTHGIVYTPQPIVDFMCAAVEEVLEKELGLSIVDPDVQIIDPATGTGNFIVNLLRRIAERHPDKLADVYRNRLFANEVMLLPYYVAALNIEHTYYELAGQYEPFEGLCFVDTLDLAEGAQMQLGFMTEANSARVERQKKAPITVIIGNPPYNVGQVNENDNNKNRKYPVIDGRIKDTYAKASKATLKMQLYDPYVKFFRWAADRLQGRDGVVCYVSNNGFVDGIAFDSMRREMMNDFTTVYHLDLHGNVRQNPKLSGTTHNVFGIQVGVGITVAVKSARQAERRLLYHRVPELDRAAQKLAFLAHHVELQGRFNSLNTIDWTELHPTPDGTWRHSGNEIEYGAFLPIGTKTAKAGKHTNAEAIFKLYSSGVKTNRDDTVYDFHIESLDRRMDDFIEKYNLQVDRYLRIKPSKLDDFVDNSSLKWDGTLKGHLESGKYGKYATEKIRTSLYRPFTRKNLYFDRFFINSIYLQHTFFPTQASETENVIICLSGVGHDKFYCLISNAIVELKYSNSTNGGTQCFPFYTYDEDGGNRRENITDWALAQFRAQYADPSISKWDIFYYVYGLLHHPDYRARFAANLRRELPRIPFAPDFRAFASAGKSLADLHLTYESAEPYPLTRRFAPGKPVSFRVDHKMRLNADKTAVQVNDSLALEGIPPGAFAYKLGNRSALEWVIDQYQVSTDARSGIVSDPNQYAPDDPEYIVRLVGQVVQVSLETARVVDGLAGLPVVEKS